MKDLHGRAGTQFPQLSPGSLIRCPSKLTPIYVRGHKDVTDPGCCAPLSGPALSEAEAAELAKVFKALSDPVRLRLLNMIASVDGGEACVCDLTGAFDLTGPTIPHHLKVLRQAGLIEGERRGT
ncbi:helix-turn-helix transcriptional regulator [Actinomadura bangladeshensis]|uniref:Helix-turn-helix transcriptional regulator n=1 Tax=Actinomadura bangladeshensis TaxID=453573 RepID=A0A6L9QHW4_9ACTN|nr:helix-turn-helix transcriptional regulator [Actinomadura bangladeshensis]